MKIQIIISYLDFFIIEKVRELRIRATPYMDQVTLAQHLGLSEGYIGNIENPKIRSKYNIRMLTRIAEALNLDSYKYFFPEDVLKYDLVKICLDLKKVSTRKHEMDGEGNIVKRFEVLSITPLSQEEKEAWKRNALNYLTVIEK
ncbi:helix-turn-helix transcriptional regulator [Salinimicrobium sp. MT39]|uniref:Helix-turn-helix transcriptional regulator n=1 Tax=Salinimicrobium profundisediminis TaxID=2994553 RepID=A0A9X3I049_9FLAO|nr:helix-turn-helix transcriptional regulator [Salinimicrobium profundisediminis]MCX2837471.1 helix-turn-helix transcriptional regulator [Salinimicrobium profundisediminis]